MRYSLSEMLHICKFCKKDFVGLKNLKSHEKKKHQRNLKKRAVSKQISLQETSKESPEYSKESEKFEFINDGIMELDEQDNLDPMQLCEVTYKIDEEISDTDEEFHEFGDVFKTDISHENYEWKVPDIGNNTEKYDIFAEKSGETLEVLNTDKEFHEFGDVFKSDISHENYEWKVPDISNSAEKYDILTEKSEETLEVSNTDEEFHGFSDNEDDEISEVEDLNIKGVLILENFFTLVQISQKRCQITPPCIFS